MLLHYFFLKSEQVIFYNECLVLALHADIYFTKQDQVKYQFDQRHKSLIKIFAQHTFAITQNQTFLHLGRERVYVGILNLKSSKA